MQIRYQPLRSGEFADKFSARTSPGALDGKLSPRVLQTWADKIAMTDRYDFKRPKRDVTIQARATTPQNLMKATEVSFTR